VRQIADSTVSIATTLRGNLNTGRGRSTAIRMTDPGSPSRSNAGD